MGTRSGVECTLQPGETYAFVGPVMIVNVASGHLRVEYHCMDTDSRSTRTLKMLAIAGLCIALLVVLVQALQMLGTTGIVILAAILITYLIAPIVQLFRRRLPLWAALLVTYLLFTVVCLIAFFAIVPPLFNEARSLISEFPKAYAYLQNEILNAKNPVVSKLPPDVIVQIQTLPTQASSIIAKYGFGVAQATLGGFFSVVTLFLSLIIVPILMAYFFFDVGEVKRGLTGLIPAPARPRT